MAHHAVIRIEKHKTQSSINTVGRHNARNYTTHAPDNINTELTQYNETLVEFKGASLWESVNAEIAHRVTGIVRPDSVRMIEVVLTSDREFFMPTFKTTPQDTTGQFDKLKLAAWKSASMQYIRDTFGAENITSAVLHVDERTPHLHVCVVPITSDGKLRAKDWTGGKQKMRALHTGYTDAVKFLGLERGREYSVAKHTELKDYYAAVKESTGRMPQIPQPPEKKPGLLASKAEKEQYYAYEEERDKFIASMQEDGHRIFSAAAAYAIEKKRRKLAEEQAAKYRQKYEEETAQYRRLYEELKEQLDAKRLRALDVTQVAVLLGYEKLYDGVYRNGNHSFQVTEKGFEFREVSAKGKNSIDFVCEHLRLTEGRPEVTPAEAIVRLAALVHDDETLRETALAGLADRAGEWLDGLQSEINRARQEHQPPREPEPLEHQPGQQLPPSPPPPAPEPEPAPEEPEPGMSM